MARIVVLDGYTINPGDNPWTPLSALGELTVYERSSASEVLARASDAELLLTNKTALGAGVLDQLPKLRGICVLATGVNPVDVARATELAVPVCNVPAYSTAAVVQHTVALLLELCHRVALHDASVHAGDWQRSADFSYWKSPLLELEGKTLGIVGYGAIGRRVAELGRGFGMRVCAARLGARATADTDGVLRLSLDDLFARADVISLHCPLTPDTAQLVSASRLALVKPGTLLLNTARGGLVDEAALRVALDSGVLAGAGLDVLSREPPLPDNPLLGAKNCVITPHLAWTSLPARQRLIATSVENVLAILAGAPVNVVNPGYAAQSRR
ncbi:MAG: D-2-hydroxyacid dehydrogenase [Pseudomonadota bacterium]